MIPMPQSESMPHAYTNRCHRVGDTVIKAYTAPDAVVRQAREESALRALVGRLPVPRIVNSQPGVLTTEYVDGVPGQELVAEGRAAAVMSALGRLLATLQSVSPANVSAHDGTGVLVHGDYGPNNAVLDPAGTNVLLLADWEWCTVGDRLTDLSWCEFIVRLHHPDHVAALPALWDGYGARPRWELRQQAMLARAEQHRAWAKTWPGGSDPAVWRERVARVQAWQELSG